MIFMISWKMMKVWCLLLWMTKLSIVWIKKVRKSFKLNNKELDQQLRLIKLSKIRSYICSQKETRRKITIIIQRIIIIMKVQNNVLIYQIMIILPIIGYKVKLLLKIELINPNLIIQQVHLEIMMDHDFKIKIYSKHY